MSLDLWLPRGPELSWQVVGLHGHEALAQPYTFDVELWCDDPDADLEQVLGADCELLLDRNGLARRVYGLITEVEVLAAAPRGERAGLGARVVVAPAWTLLQHEVVTRFFTGMTVIEILDTLLGARLADYARELDVSSRIKASYAQRDYCVQFRESTFDFCSRLMQEEGIAYVFVPDEDKQRERMVLVDNNEDYPRVELLVPEPIAIEVDRPDELDRESIQDFRWLHRTTANRVLTRGHNYKLVDAFDEGDAEDRSGPRPIARTLVLDGLQRQIIDDPRGDPDAQQFDGSALAQQVPLARRLLEGRRVDAAVARGSGNAVGFCPGGVFELEHPLPGGPQTSELLLIGLTHRASSDADGGYAYHNHFTCIPRTQVYRPARTNSKPRVHGVQTGVVIGKGKDDEVHTDALGRVRVAFHLHRASEVESHGSCWIRVAQVWAGHGYGAMVIPRVGMEVVVAFVDGDPDQPLITGCVYNANNPPPYELPEQLSKSTFKTASTPGSDHFSELRVEDGKGSEQVFVRAQRRMDLRVQGTMYATCTGDREELVGNGDEPTAMHTLTVHGELNQLVETQHIAQAKQDVYLTYDQDLYESVEGTRRTHARDLHVDANTIITKAAGRIKHVGSSIVQAGSSSVDVQGGESVAIESNNEIRLKVGKSFIVITPLGVDINGHALRLNSGGGGSSGEPVPEVEAIKDYEALLPYAALPADDGRIHSGGGAGGSGASARARQTKSIKSYEPPPMAPSKPWEPRPEPSSGSRWESIRWIDTDIWCSQPASLAIVARDPGAEATIQIMDSVSGELVGGAGVVAKYGPFVKTVEIRDVLPRPLPDGVEDSRPVLADIPGQVSTAEPAQLRFLSNLPELAFLEGRARFKIHVKDRVVEINSQIPYKRGMLGHIIHLGDLVDGVGGMLSGKHDGTRGWRYAMPKFPGAATNLHSQLVYWDGDVWKAVPEGFAATNTLGTKLHGMAIWEEDGEVKTQYDDVRAWPGPAPSWSAASMAMLPEVLGKWSRAINDFWGREEIVLKRDQCHGHERRCCTYKLSCNVTFFEVQHLVPRGIVIAENYGRSNSSAWSLRDNSNDHHTAVHEFGHHLGNPDEYEGASIDMWTIGDGAMFGVDEAGIMGSGWAVRLRHWKFVAEALAKLVARETGMPFTYSVVRDA